MPPWAQAVAGLWKVATQIPKGKKAARNWLGWRQQGPAQEEDWAAGVQGVHHPQELRRTDWTTRLHGDISPPHQLGAHSPPPKKTPPSALNSLPFFGGSWDHWGMGLHPDCHCPSGKRANSSSPQWGLSRAPPSNNHLPRGQPRCLTLDSRDFLLPQSELLRGLWLEKRCPATPTSTLHSHLLPNLSVQRGREWSCVY